VTMKPLEAKVELLRQAVRLGYVGAKGAGMQTLFNTIDAFIDGKPMQWDWDAEPNSIISYINELQNRKRED
jgi:hypothetical protein